MSCFVWRACGGVRAVMFAQCAVVGAVRDVVRACGACVLYGACVSVRCAVRGLLVCAVSGDTRHDADVVLWWVGLVASCVSVCPRVIVWCDGSGERGAGRHVREARALGLWKCEGSWLRRRRDVECVSWACIAGAVSSAVSRVLYCSIVIADVCRRVCVAAPRLVVAGV